MLQKLLRAYRDHQSCRQRTSTGTPCYPQSSGTPGWMLSDLPRRPALGKGVKLTKTA